MKGNEEAGFPPSSELEELEALGWARDYGVTAVSGEAAIHSRGDSVTY